jgi:predicted AAA+ superfamily ATPase
MERTIMARNYIPRIADEILKEKLETSGAVWIRGPKWCGKTWTAKQQARSSLMMQDPDQTLNYLRTAGVKPSLLLEGDTPRLLDEWQMAPVLWDAVRYAVDIRAENGQFILTGSTLPLDHEVKHTGTGRITRMLMRPMSLFESGESTGQVSLNELFNGEEPFGKTKMEIEELAFVTARGGWPAAIGVSNKIALAQANQYLDAVVDTDISEADGVRRDPSKVRTFLKSIARNIASTASLETIRNDIKGEDESLSTLTIRSYINALERIFVIEEQPAWEPALRSKTAIRTSPKRHFVDPSIAVAALGTNPEGLLKDFNTFGLLFESLCIRDLRIYSQSIGGNVYHYRDKTELEVDAIVSLHDGRWGAIEIKLGQKQIEIASENLLKLKEKVDEEKMQPPSFLMVLTGNGFAIKQKNGVLVVPIGCLRN